MYTVHYYFLLFSLYLIYAYYSNYHYFQFSVFLYFTTLTTATTVINLLAVATDVAARGLDISKIQHVVHYDAARSPQVSMQLCQW